MPLIRTVADLRKALAGLPDDMLITKIEYPAHDWGPQPQPVVTPAELPTVQNARRMRDWSLCRPYAECESLYARFPLVKVLVLL